MDKLIAISYFFSIIIWITGFYRIKKSDTSLNGYTFVFISVITFMCYQALVAFVLKFTPIILNNVVFAICNFMSGIMLWRMIIKKKMRQVYLYSKWDIIAIFLFVIATLSVASIQFGSEFNLYNYQCIWDSSVHLQFAKDFAKSHEFPGLYFMALNMGLWLQSIWAFVPYNTGCQIFIFSDICILLLCMCLFWHLIRYNIDNKFSYILGIIFSVLYTLGYPLNSMMYGTSCLSAGNDVVIFILIIIALFDKDKIYNSFFVCLLICGCVGLFSSYSLFIPVMFGAIFFYLIMYYYREGKISQKVLLRGLIIMVLLGAVIIVLFQNYFWNAVSGLRAEGQIYRNLAVNFVFFVPFIIMAIKKKKYNSFSMIMFFLTIIYILVCMACVFAGKISGYYYFKNYYLLWLLCFYISFVTISEAIINNSFISSYLIGWGVLLIIGMSNIGIAFDNYTNDMYGSVFGEAHISKLFDLYKFNFDSMRYRPVDDGTRELFLKVAEMNKTIDGSVYFVGVYQYALEKQFSAIANQPDIYYFDITTPEEYIKRIQDTSEYVCVVDPEYAYWDITNYLSTLEVVYQNDRGYIAKVK